MIHSLLKAILPLHKNLFKELNISLFYDLNFLLFSVGPSLRCGLCSCGVSHEPRDAQSLRGHRGSRGRQQPRGLQLDRQQRDGRKSDPRRTQERQRRDLWVRLHAKQQQQHKLRMNNIS
jgi:hypothetical protein